MQDFEQLDYYTLLGVEPSASPDAIKRAYRQQITRYHPDRYVNSNAAEQAYAQQRAQRINEAYGVLSDVSQRAAYNRALRVPAVPRTVPATPIPAAPPAAPRDHQAELYAQASAHLAAGRGVQALAILRQLQQINPFYRDVGALIAQAEAQQRAAEPAARPAANRSRRWLVASALGGVGAVGLVAAALAWRGARQQTGDQSPSAVAEIAPTVIASEAPTSAPTLAPTVAATATTAPTEPPASTPTTRATEQPTNAPTPLPSPVIEEGAVRVDEPFSNGAGWARAQQEGWSVGYADSARGSGTVYQIAADPGVGNIWSYRTAPGDISDYSLGVDIGVQGAGGTAGLLLRFQDRANYLVCLLNPTANTYRVEQHRFGRTRVIADDQLPLALDATTPTRLVARISGSALTVIVNQTLVLEADINGLPETPLYGLVAAAGDEPVVAQFDNLELR